MQLVLVHNLTPGMIIGKDIYIGDSLLLYPAGTILDKKSISLLSQKSIVSVYIDSKSLTEHASSKKTIFTKTFLQTATLLENQLQDAVTNNRPFNTKELLSGTSALFTSEMTTLSLFDMLHHMCSYDDSTYVHSLNVALISGVLGRWLNFSQEDVNVLTLCGLLHDIGKLDIPDSIVKKPGKLTDEEFSIMKSHPYKGYEILRKHKELDPRIAQAALMHHERCDGSGYPLACKHDKIPAVAKIVAIADVYDAMTSNRSYRDALCPFKVIQMLEKEGIQKYDTEYFLTFREQILNTYVNTDVLLSDDRKAHVVFINKAHLSLPIVTIDGQVVDLSTQQDLTIKAIL